MYYLIRLSRDWAELRTSLRTIRGLRSSVTKTVTISERRPTHNGTEWTLTTVTRKKKVTLSQTNWSGGKSLGCFHMDQLHRARITKIPPPGFARSISAPMRKRLR